MLIMCKLKGLEFFFFVFVVNLLMLENGWIFDDSFLEVIGDIFYQYDFFYQLYLYVDLYYIGCVIVLVLWDKKQQIIVSNELVEIICMFNIVFDGFGVWVGDYYLLVLWE